MKTKVFIAIPTTGNIRTELAAFLLQLIGQNYEVTTGFTAGGGITHNRNHLVDTFLKTDFEWFLFIDSDTVPPVKVLDMTKNGKYVCSGIYHQFQHSNIVPVVYSDKNEAYGLYIDNKTKDDVVEVDAVGAGCLLIHRKVFEKMERPYFKFLYDENGYLKLGEDFYFCRQAKKAGFKIWVDRRICSRHFKTIDMKFLFSMVSQLKKKNKIKTIGSGQDDNSCLRRKEKLK